MGPIEQLEAIVPTVSDLVDRITPAQLNDPTPCSEFTVHDVLDHMIMLGGSFAYLFRGEVPPAIDAPAVYGRVPSAEFRAAMDDLLDAVRSDQAMDRALETPLGTMDGATFAAVVAFDGLMHGWDLAAATGQTYAVDADVVTTVDEFARVALTDDLRDAGLFAAPTEAPDGASVLESLAAFSGRHVESRWRSPAAPIRIEKNALPVKMEVPGAIARQQPDFGDATGYGKMAGEYFSLGAGTDIAPLLRGLDHDACHAPHWGYMFGGELVLTLVDGRAFTFRGGDIFYWPPGHSVRVVEDADVLLFSPQDEHVAVIDHMLDQVAAG
jgi:uncharacterized protein (TIGR03086 family)